MWTTNGIVTHVAIDSDCRLGFGRQQEGKVEIDPDRSTDLLCLLDTFVGEMNCDVTFS